MLRIHHPAKSQAEVTDKRNVAKQVNQGCLTLFFIFQVSSFSRHKSGNKSS